MTNETTEYDSDMSSEELKILQAKVERKEMPADELQRTLDAARKPLVEVKDSIVRMGN